MRSSVIVACVLALLGSCDKLKQKEPGAGSGSGSGSAGPPSTGHSVTKLKADGGTALGSGVSGPENAGHNGSASGSGTGAHLVGGDGSPSHRNDDGRVHGPGGPVFMGRGATPCDAAHDHCMRDGVWFSIANIMPGKLFRALPVFEFEKKWYTWRGEPAETPGQLYKTQIAGNAQIAAGTSVIWFSSETSDTKWTDSEYEALTTSRWEAGVVESMASPTVVMIKGYGSTPLDTVRLIIETRAP